MKTLEARPATPKVNSLTIEGAPGAANVAVSWILIAASLAAGAVLGLWSFGGPVPPPPGFGGYDDLPRRLLRLAHVAGVALPMLNFHYVSWIGRTRWSAGVRRAGCRLLLLGTVALPLLLAATAVLPAALYALPVPVLSLVAAFAIIAAGRPAAGGVA